ncbi:MAG: hypothetical protein AB4352_15845 [Hormoscilla sp.]
MANLPDETLTTIFNLQRRLFQIIDLAKAAELNLVRQYGETEATLSELEQINNAQERARTSYTRLSRLLLLVAESQPTASYATMNLLEQSLERAQATADATQATIEETKRNYNLP